MKKILWGIVASIILIGVSVLLYFGYAFAPYNIKENETRHLVMAENILNQVEQFYLYTADQTVRSVIGKNNQGRDVYVIIEENNTAHLYYKEELITEAVAVQTAQTTESNISILKTVLGWYQNQPVWEVTFLTSDKKIGYFTLSAIDGKIIQHIKSA